MESSMSEIGSLPLETCQTMNGMWGYKVSDQNYKSDTTLVRLLVRASPAMVQYFSELRS